jgi:hypothetical protein
MTQAMRVELFEECVKLRRLLRRREQAAKRREQTSTYEYRRLRARERAATYGTMVRLLTERVICDQ